MFRCAVTSPLLAVVLALSIAGCGGGEKIVVEGDHLRSGATTSPFQGFFGSEDEVGRMEVLISVSPSSLAPARAGSPASATATGAISLEFGGVVSLAGTYDQVLDSLHLVGSGYDFGARLVWLNGAPAFEGRFTNSGNDGAFAGALVNSFGPHVYCGRLFLAGDSPAGRVGYVVTGVSIVGAAFFNGEADPALLEGDLDRSTSKPRISLAGASTARSVEIHGAIDEAADLSAGSWASTGTTGDATGTWSAELCP